MLKKAYLPIGLVFFISLHLAGSGLQFMQGEIAERPKWERILKTAEIVRVEDIGEGITKPKRIYLKQGELEFSGCWKNPTGIQKGIWEGWQYEIAAYKLDKYLGLNMVPPTVKRKYKGRDGSLQLWTSIAINDLERRKEGIEIPEECKDHCERMVWLARAFDSLIANIDRTQQNVTWTEDWRLILIDHSRSFRIKRLYTDQLVYGRSGIRKALTFDQLPRGFVAKVRSLDKNKIRRICGDLLRSVEIEAMMRRKKLLLKEIDQMIKDRGEDQVLY